MLFCSVADSRHSGGHRGARGALRPVPQQEDRQALARLPHRVPAHGPQPHQQGGGPDPGDGAGTAGAATLGAITLRKVGMLGTQRDCC